jgi:hypothetical protein
MKIMIATLIVALISIPAGAAEIDNAPGLLQSGMTFEQLIAESMAQQARAGVPPTEPANVWLVGYDLDGDNVDAGDYVDVTVVGRSPHGYVSTHMDVPLLASTTWDATISPPSCPGGCSCYMDSSDYTRVRYHIYRPVGCNMQPYVAFTFRVYINGDPVVGDKIYVEGTHYWQYIGHYYGFTSNKLVMTIGQPL